MVHNVWIRELRAPFLLLPTIFVPVGVAIAWTHGSFDLLTALLTLAGVISLHASVNILNDYFDYKSGIDVITTPTPFSGGSRILPLGQLSPNKVLVAGVLFLVLGISSGTYFIIRFALDPLLIAILAIAAISVVAYSPLISKLGVGELIAGLNFGPLLVIGTYYLQTRAISAEPIFVGICLGVLTACILYINEFPDTMADAKKGRMHLVARWGKPVAARRFKFIVASAYAVLVLGVILRIVTPFALLSLLAIPKAMKAVSILSRAYDKAEELIPGMANMVFATLWSGGLILLGYAISGIMFRLIHL